MHYLDNKVFVTIDERCNHENASLQISLYGIASYGNSDGDRADLRNAGLVEPTDVAVNRRGFY